MILRRAVPASEPGACGAESAGKAESVGRAEDASSSDGFAYAANRRASREGSLRGRISGLVAGGLTVAVGVTAALAYSAVTGLEEHADDTDMFARAFSLVEQMEEKPERIDDTLTAFAVNNPDYRVAVAPGEGASLSGDVIPLPPELPGKTDALSWASYSLGAERIAAVRAGSGVTVVLARAPGDNAAMQARLTGQLMGAAALGILLAALTGSFIAWATVRPLGRLRRSIDGVTATSELEPIEVKGDDEYAELTRSLNEMIASLKESRIRQAQLVADGGHELRTPLTSMRTNIELLIMLHQSGQVASIPEEDLRALEHDVTAQLEEMSTLINDLVDLAREDAPAREFEPTLIDELLADALQRVQRRRPDVQFQFYADPWVMPADRAALTRAPVNILDNAAKWSPPGGVVRISLRAARRRAVLIVDDSGPGIPPEERANVLERFYRAPESRAMPGSGLGLAIAKQVFDRHGAEMFIEESDDGGTRIRVVFPGHPPR